jgi:hypothetical protein
MKSEYRKQKDNQRVLLTYILCAILISFIWFFAGKVQQNCIEANNIALCD